MPELTPRQEFIELCRLIDTRIQEIDNKTPFTEYEPKWWLEVWGVFTMTLSTFRLLSNVLTVMV